MGKKIEQIVPAIDTNVLKKEVDSIREDFMLFSMKNYTVYCAPTMRIPNILNEI